MITTFSLKYVVDAWVRFVYNLETNLTRTIFGIYFPKTLKKSNSLFIITNCSIIYAFAVVFFVWCVEQAGPFLKNTVLLIMLYFMR